MAYPRVLVAQDLIVSMMRRMKFDVVIAGGGFAGAYCARTLGKLLGRDGEKRVALISERNVLIFQPMLAEVAGSSLSPLDVVNPLRSFCPKVTVLQGNIQHIEWSTKQIQLDGGRFTRDHVVGFDHLVFLMGSVTDLSRVPGMSDYGWPMRTVSDALRLRSALINRLEEANLVEDDEIRTRLLTFVVVGGGYTGVETAGQMLDFLDEVRPLYNNLRSKKIRVVLVHSRAHLLEEIGEKLGDYAQHVLERRGMEIILNSRVIEVTAAKAILDNGTFIETHTVVSSVGNAPNPILLDLCKQMSIETLKGRIAVEDTMRVAGQTHLWAAGDCASVPWKDKDGVKPSPPTAQFALRQGVQLGKNLYQTLKGGAIQPFRYTYMGQLATIGKREAVAEMFGLHFGGFFAWWAWRTIYLAKLPGFARKLRVMIDWTFELFFPRDISLVQPHPVDLMRWIHLEKGEVLFRRGDRMRAFFYIRRGTVALTRTDGSQEILPAGTIIDQSAHDEDGRWHCSAVAAESIDAVVFRDRALELLKNDLQLVARPRKVAPAAPPATPKEAPGAMTTEATPGRH